MSIYCRDEVEIILQKYGDMIFRMAFIQVKNKDVADDMYQEVCMKLIRQKARIEPEEHLRAWLLRTTINCCKDYWKSAWVQRVSWNEAEHQDEIAYDSTKDKEEIGFVTECVQKLPKKYRVVIHLYYYEEYSQKEIAFLLGMKENTIASWLKRGRERLKKMLEEEGEVKEYGF